MKKLLKCFISIVLVISVVLCFTCTSFAASTSWGGSFPLVKQGVSSTYNYAVQAVLARYNSSTRGYILNAGGVDGGFGEGTYNAVHAFQISKGLDADGKVGSDTWDALYNTLSYSYLSDYHSYYKVVDTTGVINYNSSAVSRYYEAVSGAVVKGWYAYKTGGDRVWFSSY